MKKFKEILIIVLLAIISPFNILFRTNARDNANRKVKFFIVMIVAVLIVAILVFLVYYAEDIFKW